MELLDALVSMRVRPALIDDIIGDRVFVKLNKADLTGCGIFGDGKEEDDPQVYLPLFYFILKLCHFSKSIICLIQSYLLTSDTGAIFELLSFLSLLHLTIYELLLFFQISGVWMDQDSPLLFYVGWSIKVGYTLLANESYVKHATNVANALKAVRFIIILLFVTQWLLLSFLHFWWKTEF